MAWEVGGGGGVGNLLENGVAWGGGVSRRPALGRRLGGSGVWWQVGWLEVVYRDSVSPVADLELEGERSAAKDLERAREGRGEGGARMKTKGAERSSGGRSGGVAVGGG